MLVLPEIRVGFTRPAKLTVVARGNQIEKKILLLDRARTEF